MLQRFTYMAPLLAVVMGVLTGPVLSLANLMEHFALFAVRLALLMGGFAAVMERFAAVVPVAFTFLVFQLTLSPLSLPEMFPVMLWRRLRAGRQRETEPQNQKRRDCCDLSLPHTEPSSTLPRYLRSSN